MYSILNWIWHLNGINRKLETLTSSWSLINNSGLPKILWFWGSSIYQFFPSISIQLFEDGDHRTGHLNINCIVELWWGKVKFKIVRFLVFCSCSRKLLPFRSGILLKPAKINANTRCEVTDYCKIQFSMKKTKCTVTLFEILIFCPKIQL